jgi:hypothetical protein
MKKHVYNCNSAKVTAQAAIRCHLESYPNGIDHLTNGKSRRVPYTDLGYVIYETKELVVINELGAR